MSNSCFDMNWVGQAALSVASCHIKSTFCQVVFPALVVAVKLPQKVTFSAASYPLQSLVGNRYKRVFIAEIFFKIYGKAVKSFRINSILSDKWQLTTVFYGSPQAATNVHNRPQTKADCGFLQRIAVDTGSFPRLKTQIFTSRFRCRKFL